MTRIVETVVEYLEEQGWSHDVERGGTVVRSGLRGDNGAYPMFFMADDESSALTLIMSTGANVPEDRFGDVCEYLARINWLLDYGSLQMDFEDGDVIFHVAVFLEGVLPTTAMVDSMVAAAISTVDAAYPGLMAVTFGGVSPMDAAGRVMGTATAEETLEDLPVA